MIIGNTFLINRFTNTRTIVQYIGYSWATSNSFLLLIQRSPTHTSFSKHSVYTLKNFVNKQGQHCEHMATGKNRIKATELA